MRQPGAGPVLRSPDALAAASRERRGIREDKRDIDALPRLICWPGVQWPSERLGLATGPLDSDEEVIFVGADLEDRRLVTARPVWGNARVLPEAMRQRRVETQHPS